MIETSFTKELIWFEDALWFIQKQTDQLLLEHLLNARKIVNNNLSTMQFYTYHSNHIFKNIMAQICL